MILFLIPVLRILVVYIAAILGVVYILPVIYNRLFTPIKNVPGPFWARFTRLWELWRVAKGSSHLEYIQWHRKYGHVVRVAPKRYSFSQPEDVKKIYQLNGSFIKSDFYSPFLAPNREDQSVFLIQDNEYHKERRRKLSPLYTMSSMVSYEDAVNKMTSVCIRKLKQFAKEQRVLSVPSFMQLYAFDVIGEITFNRSFEMMENEKDTTGMLPGINKSIVDIAYWGLIPEVYPWYSRVSWLWGDNMSGVMQLFGYTIDQVNRNRKLNEERKADTKYDTFLKKLLDLEVAHKITPNNTLDAAGSNIGAGSDTTAVSLSAVLYYLYRDARVLAKLREEMDTFAAEGKMSDPVTFAEAQSMPYLQAVLKESLRMHPAVGTILPRVVPRGGVELGGYYFPEGTHVGANAWVLHYNKDIYGPDADQYRPERWLERKAVDDNKESMMFSFGGGSRTCLGKNISLLEMNKVIPQIVRNINLISIDNSSWKTKSYWFVFPQYKARLQLIEQPASIKLD